MATKRQLREQSRKRMQKTRRVRAVLGMKAVTVVLSPAAYARLVRLKERQGGTYAQVIENALLYAHAAPPAARPGSTAPRASRRMFAPGDQLRVNNPCSRYHGRRLTVDHFSEPFGVVRGTIDGLEVRFNADYLEYSADDSSPHPS